MLIYIVRRLVQIVIAFFPISIIAYLIVRSLPLNGMPRMFDVPSYPLNIGAKMQNGVWNLSIPWAHQYVLWLQQLFSGRLGPSFYIHGSSAAQLISWALGPSSALIGVSLLLTVLVGLGLGVHQGGHAESPTDHALTGATYVLMSVPPYVLGLVVMWVFAVVLEWFPAGGIGSVAGPFSLWASMDHLVLPVLTVTLGNIALYARYVRVAFLDQMSQDYIRTAHAKGVRPRRITWRHVLPNAVMPLLTMLGTNIGQILSGIFIIEIVFAWPGIGVLFVQAVYSEDYNVLMALLVFIGVVVMLANLIIDLRMR